MMELFPWEEAEPTVQATSRVAQPPGQSAGLAPAEPARGERDRAEAEREPAGAERVEPPEAEPGEPVEIEPELQPDGDPRDRDDTQQDVGAAPSKRAEAEPVAPGTPSPAQRRPLPETQTPRHGDPLRPQARERPVARKEYYSIGEVAELVGLPAHVLRYWESQFSVLNPSKNRSGNRAYQRKEIRLILLVKHLLYEEKYTVEGAKAKLDQLRRGGTLQAHTGAALDAQALRLLRADLAELRGLLAAPL